MVGKPLTRKGEGSFLWFDVVTRTREDRMLMWVFAISVTKLELTNHSWLTPTLLKAQRQTFMMHSPWSCEYGNGEITTELQKTYTCSKCHPVLLWNRRGCASLLHLADKALAEEAMKRYWGTIYYAAYHHLGILFLRVKITSLSVKKTPVISTACDIVCHILNKWKAVVIFSTTTYKVHKHSRAFELLDKV